MAQSRSKRVRPPPPAKRRRPPRGRIGTPEEREALDKELVRRLKALAERVGRSPNFDGGPGFRPPGRRPATPRKDEG